jgi:hypothetical protein
MRDRLVITPSQIRRATQRTRQIERLRISMTSSAFFKPASSTRFDEHEARGATGRSGQDRRGEIRWPPMGRSGGRQWGVSMAAYGEIPMAAVSRVDAPLQRT